MASVSVMSELIIGKSYEQALAIFDAFFELMQSKGQSSGDENLLEDGVAFAGVSKFPARIKLRTVGLDGFQRCFYASDGIGFSS